MKFSQSIVSEDNLGGEGGLPLTMLHMLSEPVHCINQSVFLM